MAASRAISVVAELLAIRAVSDSASEIRPEQLKIQVPLVRWKCGVKLENKLYCVGNKARNERDSRYAVM